MAQKFCGAQLRCGKATARALDGRRESAVGNAHILEEMADFARRFIGAAFKRKTFNLGFAMAVGSGRHCRRHRGISFPGAKPDCQKR
jgi:hypothetical protein